ncbi:16S rRNA (adenine(1518)-N(6)/adenine(1519)-N(6))-dimethyltransferase RsmA [Actinomadura rudentiformis]|uniref:Ribosomal RNA small subunit methyltransferase A n=1 Tax=Actinomadura rudentiformis TaxID=359158 RepID=A0A6H9YE58_9ACTN|nr:16S rRNA (adenine(1518)-N(6)/adenine(1519)-N(6))-dimethyltransferase RsmA [Actinomadura rudentiformis]KAB2344051.1 16S rRNA (adenine(1518)-N(6)/adenine(1519)-N(6))-dimethyltransferase RsmA [Actinomadura rudentiformis]
MGDTRDTDALLGPADVRELAGRLGIRPTKTLGQNFVIDANTVRRIVRAAELTPEDVVIEVGPGLGSLTLALLPEVRRVTAVEIDPALAAALPETVARRAPELAARLEVVQADALRITAASGTAESGTAASRTTVPKRGGRGSARGEAVVLPGPEPTALVANLPYNVAVPVVLHLLAELPSLQRVLVMVQAEVADRMVAAPGSKIYGVPSVKLAWYGDARRAGPVGRAVFWPAPNVDSGLVAFTRREPPATTASREEVFAVVDAAFAQRRKTLRAALAGWAGSAAEAERALRAAGLDPRTRGETLDVAAFACLAQYGPGGAKDQNEAEEHGEGALAGDQGDGARDEGDDARGDGAGRDGRGGRPGGGRVQ